MVNTGTLIKETQHVLPPAPGHSSANSARPLPGALGSRVCLAAGRGTSRTEEQGAKRIGSRSRRTGPGARRMTSATVCLHSLWSCREKPARPQFPGCLGKLLQIPGQEGQTRPSPGLRGLLPAVLPQGRLSPAAASSPPCSRSWEEGRSSPCPRHTCGRTSLGFYWDLSLVTPTPTRTGI